MRSSIRPLSLAVFFFIAGQLRAQEIFPFEVEFRPVQVSGLPGLHSFAYARHAGYWLIVGGRTDGIHARQPFRSFPTSGNNRFLYVVDVAGGRSWSAPVDSLPQPQREHLQAANFNFHQVGNRLYLTGGYAYSEQAGDHVSFPFLSVIPVAEVINAIRNDAPFTAPIQTIRDTSFAVTGGELGHISDVFYLVGGHRFDGRYNPMGHATYRQRYTHAIRRFRIRFAGNDLQVSFDSSFVDTQHLRRRDFNLLPERDAAGNRSYLISSGVFRPDVDLPYLYPVEVMAGGYRPVTGFNQYLSHYHSAKVSFFSRKDQSMIHLFFGGISQYRLENGQLIADSRVPFVRTVSVLVHQTGNFREYQLPGTLPGYLGTSAAFIPDQGIASDERGILDLDLLQEERTRIGYLYGGIRSEAEHAFTRNEVSTTAANGLVYEVWLVRTKKNRGVEVSAEKAKR